MSIKIALIWLMDFLYILSLMRLQDSMRLKLRIEICQLTGSLYNYLTLQATPSISNGIFQCIHLSTFYQHTELAIYLKPASGLIISIWAWSMVGFQIAGTQGNKF